MFNKEEWVKSVFTNKTKVLSRDNIETICALISVESAPPEILASVTNDFEDELPTFKIVQHRVDCINGKLSVPLMAWCVYMAEGNVGFAIMLATACVELSKATGGKMDLNSFLETQYGVSDMNSIVGKFTAMVGLSKLSVPSDKSLIESWTKQKVDGVNMIDQTALWM